MAPLVADPVAYPNPHHSVGHCPAPRTLCDPEHRTSPDPQRLVGLPGVPSLQVRSASATTVAASPVTGSPALRARARSTTAASAHGWALPPPTTRCPSQSCAAPRPHDEQLDSPLASAAGPAPPRKRPPDPASNATPHTRRSPPRSKELHPWHFSLYRPPPTGAGPSSPQPAAVATLTPSYQFRYRGQPMGYATSTTRAATRPTPAERTEAEALLTRPEMLQRLRRDRSELVEMPLDPTPETATGRLARLAVRQAGHQGEPALGIEVPHPRFAQAVEAATAAPDKQRALEAATAILKGPEAAKAFQDHPPPPGEAMANPSDPPTDQATIALS